MNYRFITLLFGSARMFFDQSRVILFLHQLIHVLDFAVMIVQIWLKCLLTFTHSKKPVLSPRHILIQFIQCQIINDWLIDLFYTPYWLYSSHATAEITTDVYFVRDIFWECRINFNSFWSVWFFFNFLILTSQSMIFFPYRDYSTFRHLQRSNYMKECNRVNITVHMTIRKF